MANLGLQNNNPGNLKDPKTGLFRVFNTPQEGHQALLQDLMIKQSGQSQHIKPGASIKDLANVWAPASDRNKPEDWASNVAKTLGVPTAYAFDKIPPEKLAEGIKVAEGTSTLPSAQNNNISSFAQKIKMKYPEYNDIPDEELATKVLQKYPQYQDMISQPQTITNQNQIIDTTGSKDITQEKTTKPQKQTLGQEIGGRIQDINTAISNPDINIASKVIQSAGAAAGGLGDIVNAGLNKVSLGLLDKVTGLVGVGVQKLAETETGQSILKSVQDFSQQHPELSADIGAGINIVTALPILKGIGVVKNVAMDAASIGLKKIAEKAAVKEFSEVARRTVGGNKLIKQVPDGLKTLVENRAIPTVEQVGNRYVYNIDEAQGILQKTISKIDDTELQPILDEISSRQAFGQNLSTLKKLAIKEAQSDIQLREAGVVPKAIKQIEERFKGWRYSYGDTVDLATQNRLKIGSGKFTNWGTPEGTADKAIYRALQKNIEEVASKNGIKTVHSINQKMAKLLNSEKLLSVIKNKPVKTTGLIHGMIKNAATVGGEVAGNAVGIPFAGALVGRSTGGLIENTLGKLAPRALRNSILQRTAPDYAKQSLLKAKGLVGASIINRTNRPQNP